tara:strand:+ start:1582 stop:2598 length:1017 start_codon:yes stop_codon:yes gene_type:complete
MATSSYFGRNSFVGVAVETDYGTAVTTPTVTRPIISCSMLRQVEKVERANLRVMGTAGLRKGHYIVADKVTGSLELEATYDNCGYFLHHALGESARSAGADGDGIYTHTYSLGEVPAAGTTLRLQRGTSDFSETFEGVVFNVLTMSCAAGEHMTMSLEMLGETSGDSSPALRARGNTGLTLVDPSHENLVLHHHAGNMSWNSQTFNLIDFEYKLENGIAERMRLGSLLTKQPVQSDFRSATVTVSFETDDINGYQAFIADNTSDLTITFDNDGSAAAYREMKFQLNNAYIESYTDEISEVGLITASVTFKGQADGGAAADRGGQIIVKNVATTTVDKG